MPELPNIPDEAWLQIVSYGPWFLLAGLFIVFGLKEIGPIIRAIGDVLNQRRKNEQLHTRNMRKLDNQRVQPTLTRKKQTGNDSR